MILKTSKFFIGILFLFLMNACDFEDVQFRNAENFKLKQFEGKKASLSFDAVLYNPNGYNLKVKPSTFDLYINNVQVGVIKLDEKVKIKKRTESTVTVPVTAELSPGILPKLLTIALSKSASVRIVGTARGGVSIFTKKKKIDETREIPLKDLNLLDNIPFLNN